MEKYLPQTTLSVYLLFLLPNKTMLLARPQEISPSANTHRITFTPTSLKNRMKSLNKQNYKHNKLPLLLSRSVARALFCFCHVNSITLEVSISWREWKRGLHTCTSNFLGFVPSTETAFSGFTFNMCVTSLLP